MGNVVLRDNHNKPSIFVRHPKQNSNEFDASLPNHTHPAFIVDDVEVPAVLIGKYLNSVQTSGGTMYSLPNAPVVSYTSGLGNAYPMLEAMRSFGGTVSGKTMAEHGLHVLMAHAYQKQPGGNTDNGADIAAGTRFDANQSVTKGDIRIYQGFEYICLITHVTSNALAPDIAPGYWRKGDKVGGITVSPGDIQFGATEQAKTTLTGSGPLDWYLLDNPAMEADLVGNSAETIYGLLLRNGELLVLPNNNAANPLSDLSVTSSAWRAIKPHANNNGYDYVAPGTSGTIHYGVANNHITIFGRELESSEFVAKTEDFRSIQIDTNSLPYVPSILYELGLAPISGTSVSGVWNFQAEENVYYCPRTGGFYSSGSAAGIAAIRWTDVTRFYGPPFGSRCGAYEVA